MDTDKGEKLYREGDGAYENIISLVVQKLYFEYF